MQDVIAFWTACLQLAADFLMTEPVSWFTGVFVLFAVVGLVRRIIS